MKFFLLMILIISNMAFATKASISDAPIEWLIVQTLMEKSKGIDTHDDHFSDPLVEEIFKNIVYLPDSDEIILQSSKSTHDLKSKLIHFIDNKLATKDNKNDELYLGWLQEGHSLYDVQIQKTKSIQRGHYFFNHVHTSMSNDNRGFYYRKMSPETTFRVIESFLKMRRAKGSVTFTDHDTDQSFDMVKHLQNENLSALRGIEWGGKLHMNLIGLKENWDNLSHGREYAGEESVRQSRSSNAFRVINHPNGRDPFFPYTSWLDANGIEVWNSIIENKDFNFLSFLSRSNNRAALGQWSDALKLGKRYTAVGGSDYHFWIPCLRDRALFYPANYIPSDKLDETKKDLMSGNTSFITGPRSPKMNLRAKFSHENKWSGMGDKLIGDGIAEIELDADFIDTPVRMRSYCYNIIGRFSNILNFRKKKLWELRFYNREGEVVAKKQVNPAYFGSKTSFTAKFKLPIKGTELIRVELWDIYKNSKEVDLLGATNPIYFN